MPGRIVILGGGFGGLTAATSLRERLGPEPEIVVIDRKPSFLMGLAKLWVLTGERTIEEGRRDRTLLAKKGVRFVQAEVEKIDLEGRSVSTNSGSFHYDYLVVALGAELAPQLVPGLQEGGLNLYDPDQVLRTSLELSGFTVGSLVVLICGMPFKCPPAPYEAMMLIDDMLRKKGLRDSVQLDIYTAEPMPVPIAGQANSAKLQGWLSAKGIGLHVNHKPVKIEAGSREIVFESGERTKYDFLLAVPPHRSQKVVVDAGLVDASGWIPVEPRTLKTKYDKVFAVGDATAVKLPNGMMLPKAGIFAEAEANVVAAEIASEMGGELSMAGFDGKGLCFIESGEGKASAVRGEFFTSPGPKLEIDEPSAEWLTEKHNFEKVRLDKWFGRQMSI